jgi:isopentenyl diphosphate isomerase/L-lactate dehydrogenase-like FMN-dependent dehydrogenase
MFGRPYLYGVGAAGEMGVDWVVDYFNAGITRTMALVGATDLASWRGTARIGD